MVLKLPLALSTCPESQPRGKLWRWGFKIKGWEMGGRGVGV